MCFVTNSTLNEIQFGCMFFQEWCGGGELYYEDGGL